MCNIRLLLATTLLSYCLGARLDSTYLPPGANRAEGGPGLTAPFGGGGGTRLNGGVRPGTGGPKPTYGAPVGGGKQGSADAQATIISYENENDGSGTYKWGYETNNGIKADESGELKNAGSDAEAIAAVGSFSYTAPDGTEIKVEYTADENGFVPKGDHLPTPPPIPPEILKSLEQNAAEEAAGGGNGYPTGNGNDNGNGNGYRY